VCVSRLYIFSINYLVSAYNGRSMCMRSNAFMKKIITRYSYITHIIIISILLYLYYYSVIYTQRRLSCVCGEFNELLDKRAIAWNRYMMLVYLYSDEDALLHHRFCCRLYRLPSTTLLYNHLTLDVHIVSICYGVVSSRRNPIEKISVLKHTTVKKKTTYTSQFEFFKSSTDLYNM